MFGVVVRSRGLGGNIMAGLRSIVGGEITEYTAAARGGAPPRGRPPGAERDADGRNAVVMMRFDSAEIGQTMSEIVAYGTAAIVEPGRARGGVTTKPARVVAVIGGLRRPAPS